MKIKVLIGSRIKELRKTRGLSQERLSERAEITPNYLSRVERGTENPTLDTLIKLTDALGVEMWEVFDFGHITSRKNLKETLSRFAGETNEETLRVAVKVFRALVR